jgi:hypothetical protein
MLEVSSTRDRVVAAFSDRSSGRIFQGKNSGNVRGGKRSDPRAQRWMLFEVKMALFSRSFLRKRAISVATTLVVTVVSLAFGHQPAATHRVHPAAAVQQVSVWPAPAETPLLHASQVRPETARPCDLRVHLFKATDTSPPSPS